MSFALVRATQIWVGRLRDVIQGKAVNAAATATVCTALQTPAQTKSSRVTVVKRCVAAGCSNTTSATVSLHKFPSNPAIRQLWVKAVQKTRAEWKGPSEHSRLCSEHFEDSCSESNVGIASKMGIQTLRRLRLMLFPLYL